MKKIRRTNKYEVRVKCENCDNIICASYDKVRNKVGGYCYDCGYKFEITSRELDFIQPDNSLFDIIYSDSKKEYEKQKKIAEWEKQKRLEALEEKYEEQYRDEENRFSIHKPWELKDLKNKVLKEK